MLDFFRRYQWYFFLFITIIIIISFSFFGTYQTIGAPTGHEQVIFHTAGGREITRGELEEMVAFLGTDQDEQTPYGGVWGPNFLNDGVIRKDFLETGLAKELVIAYREDLQDEINSRLKREKGYVPYAHPQAPFIGLETIWKYVLPDLHRHYTALSALDDGVSKEGIEHRIQLYLIQRQLPTSALRYILRQQERQYQWITADEKLGNVDLALFGHHSLEDWFGPQFMRLVAAFILNAADLAEGKGYSVSKAEAWSDLIQQTRQSYDKHAQNPYLGVTSPEEYLAEQLRRLNMDQARAIKVWRHILLFRRYFQDAGSSALVDPIMSRTLNRFARDSVSIDLYALPAELSIAHYDDLQKLESYLRAVAPREGIEDPLALPTRFFSVEEVAQNYPELVQKQYTLHVAQVEEKGLQARIGLRELWQWQTDESHWTQLTKQFPLLAKEKGESQEDRFAALERLDPSVRKSVDTFSKRAIVQAHPEWIDQALERSEPTTMKLGLRSEGGKMPLKGLVKRKQREALMTALDQATPGVPPLPDSPLYRWTGDQQHYYRITLIERADSPQILTFAEARYDGTLDKVRDRFLESEYVRIRDAHPLLYRKGDADWQPFAHVRDLVAQEVFKKVLDRLMTLQEQIPSEREKGTWSQDQAATWRYYPYLVAIRNAIIEHPDQANVWLNASSAAGEPSSSSIPLQRQWHLDKRRMTVSRQKQTQPPISFDEVTALGLGNWSSVHLAAPGLWVFYQVIEKDEAGEESIESVVQQTRVVHAMLSNEAQLQLAQQVMSQVKLPARLMANGRSEEGEKEVTEKRDGRAS